MWMPVLAPSYGSSNGLVAVLNILRPSGEPRSTNAAVCKAAGVREKMGGGGRGGMGGTGGFGIAILNR